MKKGRKEGEGDIILKLEMNCHIYHPSVKMCVPSHSVVSHSETQGLEPARLLCPWDFSGKNTGVSCHFLLQGIFPTQGSNPSLLHWQVDYLPLSHRRSASAYTLHDFKSTMTVPLDHTGSKRELKMQVLASTQKRGRR